MFKSLKKIRNSIIVVFAILILIEVLFLLFGRGQIGAMSSGLLLMSGLLIGALLSILIWQYFRNKNYKQLVTKESSHTVVESVKKVFKIVLVEGQFSEIYNFEETQNVLGIIPSTKKALVMNKSKVMLGFDFNKCVWEVNESNQTLRIIEFPEAEILSMDTDLKYYNLENGLFNKFDKDDYAKIQENIKEQIKVAVHKSDLPQLANEQIKVLLKEVIDSKHWIISSQSKNLLLN